MTNGQRFWYFYREYTKYVRCKDAWRTTGINCKAQFSCCRLSFVLILTFLFSVFCCPIRNQKTQLNCVILHTFIGKKGLKIAMQPSADHMRRIILTTDIAESSITVPDVKYGSRNSYVQFWRRICHHFISNRLQSSIFV